MPISPTEFIGKKGAIEVLCEINPAGSRFQELTEGVSISRPTLSNRLAEGREASLLDTEAVAGKRGTTHRHVLTPRGATVRMLLFEQNVESSYKQYRTARLQFEKNKDKFREFLRQNTPNLSLEEQNHENYQTLLQRSNLSHMVEDDS